MEKQFTKLKYEAGCDEAGRGCLAGPVFAAAVIIPKGVNIEGLNDSKQLTEKQRDTLRIEIEAKTIWAVEQCTPEEIDTLNILWASVSAMHKALSKLTTIPYFVSVDGNRFKKWNKIPFATHVKGDARFMNIAAASILAKTYRDEYMKEAHQKFPMYGWNKNKGYPTVQHREGIAKFGICHEHRKSFRLLPLQGKFNF
ncbi:MAG: ribonuclease HII [Bacteroidetes bacterium]|nr:ribonuclease HII [Bacteroidota bacterium]